jgi:hypothetical protein
MEYWVKDKEIGFGERLALRPVIPSFHCSNIPIFSSQAVSHGPFDPE